MAGHRHIGLLTGRDTRIATVIMRAVPDTRRLSLIPKFISYLLIFVFVSFSSKSWALEVNPEISEIRDDNRRLVSDESSIIIQPVNSDVKINNEKKDIREKKTILSDLPDNFKEITKVETSDDVSNSDQLKTFSENVNAQNNNEGIRRFDVEIHTDEEQPVNDGQIIESAHKSDVVINRDSDGEHVKLARDDVMIHKENEAIDSSGIKKGDLVSDTEKLNEDSLTLKHDIEVRNPFLKKFLLNKSDNEEQNDPEESNIRKLRSGADKRSDIIQRIKEKAMLLQEQMRNTTILQMLKDQMEVLPEIPSFTENQLLEGLKLILSQRKISQLNESYSSLNVSELNSLQQEILKCAEELIVQRQRQSFMNNISQCVRSLSVLNCMRIFVYPVLIENIPQSLADNFPIEINLVDIIQGNRNKIKTSRINDLQANDLLTPEWQIYSILKSMLQNYPMNEKFDLFVDMKNETLASLLSPNQILILQMGEHLLPETVRQEYANQMFSCIRRFEYYSCLKYFAWPMIKHYLPMLPEFPSYYLTPSIVTEYPEFIPYPAYQMDISQLPEIIDADGTRNREPKPEAVILRILQTTLREQQNLVPTQTSYIDYNRLNSRITREQLESLRASEQLLPASVRSDYASKIMSCINRYNYLHCIKHSTWPTVRKYTNISKFPDISSYTNFPNLSGYISSWSNLPNIAGWFNKPHNIFGGGSGEGSGTVGGSGPITGGGSGSGSSSGSITGGGSGSGTGLGSGVGSGSGSGGGLGGLSDPSGGISGQNPGYPMPGIPSIPSFPGGSQQTGSGSSPSGFQQFIPPYPFIPIVPYPWYPPQIPMNPSQGVGGGIQGGGSGMPGGTGPMGSEIGPNDQWNQWMNNSDPNQSGSGSTGSSITGGGTSPGTGSNSGTGSNISEGSGVPSYPSAPCKSYLKNEEMYEQSLITWEEELIEILKKARDSIENISATSSLFEKSKIPLSLTIRQLTILRFAEDLLPTDMTIRQDITTKMLECLEEKNLFANCLRIIMFPGIKEFVPSLPKLPLLELSRGTARADDNSPIQETPENHLISESENLQFKKTNEPVISVTGTRFVPIFTEHPESVIYNIIRSIRLSDPHFSEKTTNSFERFNELSKSLSDRQQKILLSAAELIPNKSREEFINKTLLCTLENAFLHCAKSVVWPYVYSYVPELPSFPNFDNVHEKKSHIGSFSSAQNPTVLETNIEANQHGEHHITITDTRFVPVLSEQPETVVLKILKSVQLSVPNLSMQVPGESLVEKNAQTNLLSSEQVDILKTAEKLLPDGARETFITKMFDCIGHNIAFLDCTKDIAFPTVGQFHPSLSSFPNFGSSVKSDKNMNPSNKILQSEIENALRHASIMKSEWNNQKNIENARAVYSYPILTEQQVNIIKLAENLLPETVRIAYRARMIDCIRIDSFLSCTQRNWPIVKQFVPSLPDFSNSNNLYSTAALLPLSSLQHIPHLPQLSPIPPISEITFNNGISSLPTVVDRRTVLPYDLSRMFRQMHPLNGAAPTLVQGNHVIPPYAGQPTSNFINLLSTEQINVETLLPSSSHKNVQRNESKRRFRRNIVDQSYTSNNEDVLILRKLEEQSPNLNITESELLRILIHVIKTKENIAELKTNSDTEYLIDDIYPNIRNNLTADQYEILKIIPQLNPIAGKAGFMNRIVQCIQSLSFIRCAGIFIWPMISSNLPSLPSLPVSLPIPGIGSFLGRSSTEIKDMSTVLGLPESEFENQLLERKNSTEKLLLEWYEYLLKEKFEINLGLFKIRGYGNQKLGITFSDARNGRSTKFKSRRNIPHLLTIISNIIKDIFSGANADKTTTENITKNRKIRNILQKSEQQELNLKDLKNEHFEFDDCDFKAFLSKFKFNITNYNENINEMIKYLDMKEAYKAFDVLFGTGLTHKIISKLKLLKNKEEQKIIPLQIQEENIQDDLKIIKLNDQAAYEFGIEEENQDGRRIKKKRLIGTELSLRLPRVNEKLISQDETNNLIEIGRKMQTSASQMLPGIGLLMSMFLQMLLAHARAAASVAGLLSNMAMGTAMFGMIRQSLFGSSTHPKIKYVYDNADTGPGITWSQ